MCSARLGFAHWQPGDIRLATELWGAGDVTRYISATGRFSPADIAARLQTEVQNGREHGVQYWPLFEREHGTFIGCCGLRPHLPAQGSFELGIHLKPEHWGKGYALEAAKQVVAHAFSALGVKEIIAGHHPDNTASGKLLQRLGFQQAGTAFYPPTGLMHAAYRYVNPPENEG